MDKICCEHGGQEYDEKADGVPGRVIVEMKGLVFDDLI
jgi:hypothetical protein